MRLIYLLVLSDRKISMYDSNAKLIASFANDFTILKSISR
jgi:hypothetical protein